MWVAEIAVPGMINASKRNTRAWSNSLKSKICCDAQQLPDCSEIRAATPVQTYRNPKRSQLVADRQAANRDRLSQSSRHFSIGHNRDQHRSGSGCSPPFWVISFKWDNDDKKIAQAFQMLGLFIWYLGIWLGNQNDRTNNASNLEPSRARVRRASREILLHS